MLPSSLKILTSIFKEPLKEHNDPDIVRAVNDSRHFYSILKEKFESDWPLNQIGSDKWLFQGRIIKFISTNNQGDDS